jgi:modification target Cys-rich repeat protein
MMIITIRNKTFVKKFFIFKPRGLKMGKDKQNKLPPVSKKNEILNKEISRREFFKKVSFIALPTIAFFGFGSPGRELFAFNKKSFLKPKIPADCENNCEGTCTADCAGGCAKNCDSGCTGDCTGSCEGACSGQCEGKSGTSTNKSIEESTCDCTGCTGSCTGHCQGGCFSKCNGTCSGDCTAVGKNPPSGPARG